MWCYEVILADDPKPTQELVVKVVGISKINAYVQIVRNVSTSSHVTITHQHILIHIQHNMFTASPLMDPQQGLYHRLPKPFHADEHGVSHP